MAVDDDVVFPWGFRASRFYASRCRDSLGVWEEGLWFNRRAQGKARAHPVEPLPESVEFLEPSLTHEEILAARKTSLSTQIFKTENAVKGLTVPHGLSLSIYAIQKSRCQKKAKGKKKDPNAPCLLPEARVIPPHAMRSADYRVNVLKEGRCRRVRRHACSQCRQE